MPSMMQAVDVVEVIDALELVGIDVWVYGGWGIDALLKEQTRPHDDLDVIIRADDIEAAIRVTRGLGFSLMTDELPQGFTMCDMRDMRDHRVDFHPVRFQEDGSAVQKIKGGGEWVFSSPGLQGTGSVNGREIRCLTPEEHAIRASDQSGALDYEPTKADQRDIRLLQDRFRITLPYPYDNDPA
ncbi:nucleotidyltransferase domain-containing protein [Chloroflexota bacterium]